MRLPTAFVVALATLSACDDGSPSGPSQPNHAAVAADQSTKAVAPIVGTCEESIVEIPIDFLPPPWNDFPAHAAEVGVGSCRVSHLGRSSVSSNVTGDFTGFPFPYAGTRVYTAANGDQLWTTESGIILPPENKAFVASGTVTISGGTGRFGGASGQATVEQQGVVTAFGRYSIRYRFEGTISY